MTDDEVRDELVTLLFAGHETPATSLAWAFDLLLHHPDALDRLSTELKGGNSEYLDAVIKETLRLRPVVALVDRLVRETSWIGQHAIQAGNGSNILIDGSVQLTQSGDTLAQVLSDWMQYGATATNVASIRCRLNVTDNSSHANTLTAGSGLDWFFALAAQDTINPKATDLLN